MNRYIATFLAGILYSCNTLAVDTGLANSSQTCDAPTTGEKALYVNDFRWNLTLDEMREEFDRIYASPARLANRAQWNSQSKNYELIMNTGDRTEIVNITEQFINSIRQHIEFALENDYAKYVFLPDLGHSHLLIWRPFYEDTISDLPIENLAQAYEQMLDHPETRFLYHSAEQLMMLNGDQELLPGRYLGWRFYTRNLEGGRANGNLIVRHAPESPFNTAHIDNEDYRWWSSGIYFSANHKGCFAYVQDGDTRYFDISLAQNPSRFDPYVWTWNSIANIDRIHHFR